MDFVRYCRKTQINTEWFECRNFSGGMVLMHRLGQCGKYNVMVGIKTIYPHTEHPTNSTSPFLMMCGELGKKSGRSNLTYRSVPKQAKIGYLKKPVQVQVLRSTQEGLDLCVTMSEQWYVRNTCIIKNNMQ